MIFTNSGPDFDSGAVELGDTLNISGQVYLCDWDEEDIPHYYAYDGANYAVTTPYGGTGQISNGKLDFSISTPSGTSKFNIEDLIDSDGYSNINVSAEPQSVVLDDLYINCGASDDNCEIERGNVAVENKSGVLYWTEEWVDYVYVSSDVTVSGKGKTIEDSYSYEGETWSETVKYSDFNFTLKKGWNSVHHYGEGTEIKNYYTHTTTAAWTISMTLSNPPLRWVFNACEEHE